METLSEELSSLKTLLGVVLLRLSELELENIELKARILELESENSDLKRRLGMTSNNSHKPPSSDGLGKKPALVRSKGGTIGGQKGHEGHTLKCVSEPDVVVLHQATACSCCGRIFSESEGSVLSRRQVFDIPLPKLVVTEHRLLSVSCCG